MPKKKLLRVLIVENSPGRQEVLRNLYRDHAWILVNTAARANRLLDAYDFDLVSLDFDLDGGARGDQVALHLRDSRNAAVTVIVHSDNHPGANKIKAILPSAACVPFSKITKSNSIFKKVRRELAENGVDVNWESIFATQSDGNRI
ncbi:MAG: response regulator [Thermodesulfobacteriota bacterium]